MIPSPSVAEMPVRWRFPEGSARLASRPEREAKMTELVYRIVEHDGGWAYRVGATFSETFRTREEAHRAANRAALEQRRAFFKYDISKKYL